MLDMWLNLDYKRMLFEKEEVADQAKRVVTLQTGIKTGGVYNPGIMRVR